MRVSYFKDKKKLEIEFHIPAEEIWFRNIMRTWSEQEERLQYFIDIVLSVKEEKQGLFKKVKLWKRKKAKMVRVFIFKLFGFDIGKPDDLKAFADAVVVMVEMGKMVDEAVKLAHERKIISPGNSTIN